MTNGKRKYLSCKKDCHVSLKLSEEDFMKLESDAKSAGMDRSKYLRALIQNAKGQIYFSAIEEARQKVVKLQDILKEVLEVWQLRKSCA